MSPLNLGRPASGATGGATTMRLRAPTAMFGALLLAALTVVGAGCSGFGAPPGDEPPSGTAAGSAEPTAGSVGVPLLRVGLAEGVDEAKVGSGAAFTVAVYAEDVRRFATSGGSEWTFRARGDGIDGRSSGGGFSIGEGTVRVTADGAWPLVIDGVAYHGEVELFLSASGALSVVNVVDIETYLRGVVPKEIGPRPVAEIEAVKAQAVAARTYAIASGGKRSGGDFDLFGTVSDQVYAGVAVENAVCDRAIAETAGIVATYDRTPINAYFHANCGGRTEARQEVWELEEVPYLRSVWDTQGGTSDRDRAYCRAGSHFEWEASWTGGEIEDLVHSYLPSVASTPVKGSLGIVKDIRVTERTPSGRIRWLEVRTAGGTYRVFGDRVRWLLRRPGGAGILRSAWFDLSVKKRGGRVDWVTATGHGYGHGVGMCQHGAMEMARRGHSYEEILKHYYAGIELARDYGAE